MAALTLYCEGHWDSPWVLHALVALEEKRLPYEVVVLDLPMTPAQRSELAGHALLAKVPLLVDGDLWFTESLAISEYLAETYKFPDHPRLFPPDLRVRARARQLMMWLRTDLALLRTARPTSTFLGPCAPVDTPLGDAAAAQAGQLIAVATQALGERRSIGDAFCIADVDLALALMRLIRNRDAVPAHLVAYAEAVWARPSVQAFVARARR